MSFVLLKMYIAFKWLFALTFAMWITMCCLDSYTNKRFVNSVENFKSTSMQINRTNTVSPKSSLDFYTEKYKYKGDKQFGMVYLYCFMFVAGALVVTLYNRMYEISIFIQNSKREIANIFTSDNTKRIHELSKITITALHFIILIWYNEIYPKLRHFAYKVKNVFCSKLKFNIFKKPRVNLLLLEKLKEVGEQRRNLAQMLIAALQENKNIRMQYQLENMAKKRLGRHIEKTEQLIKENRSRYVSFQQLYLVTHQENTFLKFRVKKLAAEKAEAEKDLLELMNEIFKSKNNELKAYCSRFVVKSKRSLLNSDVRAEIQTFLRRSRGPGTACLNRQDFEVKKTNSWLRCSSCTQIAELVTDKTLVPLVTEAPKLRGLPGECVWTIKDKDGLIQKIYECDYESDFNAGDTIRRIREYSVYHDKDCLLDFSNSTTVITTTRTWSADLRHSPYTTISGPVTNGRFLTGSEAFKKFMQNNENVVSTSVLPMPRLLAD